MRIGMMLRAIEERGGVGVYTRNLTDELLRIDPENEYTLFYRSPAELGRYANRPNVTERVVRAPNKAAWDQLAVPLACWRDRIDVVFHPKFTVPFLAPCKAVMVLHGTGWFTTDFFGRLDVAYIRALLPMYFRRSAAVLSVSQLGADFYNARYGLPEGKIRTVYFGPGKHFRRVTDPAALAEVRAKYDLPERFILTLTKHKDAERKNIRGVLGAYALLHGTVPQRLVVGGTDCHRFRDEYDIPAAGWGRDVLFPGWIDQADLPAIYSLADLYLYPSNMEAFPIPLTEAMACGTPIVTSNVNGLLEIAGNAALFVDPGDPASIASGARRVLTDPTVRAALAEAGRARSQIFNWERCARETLAVLRRVHANGGGR